MSEAIATAIGLALSVLFVLLALYIGSGRIPGERLYELYRLHRDTYDCDRKAAFLAAWFIWRPW